MAIDEIKIYLLRDPLTLDIKYIGKTNKELQERLIGHIHESYFRQRQQGQEKSNWIRGLFQKFTLPIIELIEVTNVENGPSREKYWIQYYTNNYRLFNSVFNPNNPLERVNLRVKVYQYNKKGEFLKEWESLLSVEKTLNIITGNIIQACKNKRKLAGEFMWRYYKVDKLNSYKKDLFKKPVYRYSLSGELLEEYTSARECIGYNYKNISQCCTGEKYSHKGFQWSFDKVSNIGVYSRKYNYLIFNNIS